MDSITLSYQNGRAVDPIAESVENGGEYSYNVYLNYNSPPEEFAGILTVSFNFPEIVCDQPVEYDYCVQFDFPDTLPEPVRLDNTDAGGTTTYDPYDFTQKCETASGSIPLEFTSILVASVQLLPQVTVIANYVPCSEESEMPPP